MKLKYLTATAATVLLLAVATDGFVQERERGDDKRHGHGDRSQMRPGDFGDPERMVEMMTRHLELDATQTEAVGNILLAAKPEADALRERATASQAAMRSLDVGAPDYGSQLQNLSTEIGAVTAAATLLHGRLRADVYAVLTPEQREKASAGRGAMRDHFRRSRMNEQE